MVVKAGSEDGRRLHIDKEMLRLWREDFARMMREQGIAANATPRAIRGKIHGKTKDAIYRAHRRHASTSIRQRVTDVVNELRSTGTIRYPAKRRLLETRQAVIANWNVTADLLDAQAESTLASEVRHFARHLPNSANRQGATGHTIPPTCGRQGNEEPSSTDFLIPTTTASRSQLCVARLLSSAERCARRWSKPHVPLPVAVNEQLKAAVSRFIGISSVSAMSL
jgi:hypothetical protein